MHPPAHDWHDGDRRPCTARQRITEVGRTSGSRLRRHWPGGAALEARHRDGGLVSGGRGGGRAASGRDRAGRRCVTCTGVSDPRCLIRCTSVDETRSPPRVRGAEEATEPCGRSERRGRPPRMKRIQRAAGAVVDAAAALGAPFEFGHRECSPRGFPRLVPVARCEEAVAGTPARQLTTRRCRRTPERAQPRPGERGQLVMR